MHDAETLSFIEDYIHRKGYGPSMREIANGNGYSVKTAHKRVHELVESGHIKADPRIARTIHMPRGEENSNDSRQTSPATGAG